MKQRHTPMPAEGTAREERQESHRQEMEEQAKGQGDRDMVPRMPPPTKRTGKND